VTTIVSPTSQAIPSVHPLAATSKSSAPGLPPPLPRVARPPQATLPMLPDVEEPGSDDLQRLALQPGEDRASRRVGKRRKSAVETFGLSHECISIAGVPSDHLGTRTKTVVIGPVSPGAIITGEPERSPPQLGVAVRANQNIKCGCQ